jgi:uncharacterized BrkB/YihY/UPF0761 family membrane protein
MPGDYAMDNNRPAPQRPWLHRLLHTIGEVLLSFLFAGGVFLASVKLMCLNEYRCDDFGGVAFFVSSFIVALVIWGWFLWLCRKMRERQPARNKLDIATAIITVILWVAFFPS